MYEVRVFTGGKEYLLYDPHDPDYQIFNDEISEEIGKTSTFTFSIPADAENIAQIKPMASEIRIYRDRALDWWGRPVTPVADIYNTQTVQCVSGLSYLADSLQEPFTFTGTAQNLISQILARHNSQVSGIKQVQLGQVSMGIGSGTWETDAYADTLSTLQTIFVNAYGGYLRVRESGGVRYLDYFNNYGETNSQVIRFGENIRDISSEIDATDAFTTLIPEGAETDGVRVDITSVNGGLNYIESAAAVSLWGGRIWRYIQYDDITTPAELLAAAQEYLDTAAASLPESINLSAVDLSVIDVDIEALQLGYWTRVESAPHGISGTYILAHRTRHLTHPANDTITLGITKKTISGETANTGTVVAQEIKKISSQISKTVDAAVENATQLITGGQGGYVVIDYNESKHPQELLIMDAPTKEAATHILRMNQNGIGFSQTGINGPYTNAWTIDGSLVADFITAGTMYADRIRGGTLSLGGAGNGDGVLKVFNASGKMIGIWDNSGIELYSTYGNYTMTFDTMDSQHWRAVTVDDGDGGVTYIIPGILEVNSYESGNRESVDRSVEIDVSGMYVGEFDGGSSPSKDASYTIDLYSNDGTFAGYLDVDGDFYVGGHKDRIVKTADYGDVGMAAYETPVPMFGDVGSGIIGEDGMCRIWMDPVYMQTVSGQLYIFLQPRAAGEFFVSGEGPGYFDVTGPAGAAFDWTVNARQKDFANERFDGRPDRTVYDETAGKDGSLYYINYIGGLKK